MKLRFKTAVQQTNDVSTFVFTPLRAVSWKAGQSIKLEVAGTYGPIEHRFTISSAPHEHTIAITTRNSGSAYKKRLFSLRPGEEIRAFAIEGDFTWQDTPAPKIWIAAGIGITPFYSMLKDRVFKELPLDVTLFFSSRSEAIFKKELNIFAAEHPEFKFFYLDNRVTARHVLALPNAKKSLIYISGPSAMVDEISGDLINSGIKQSHIIRDWFTGRLDA